MIMKIQVRATGFNHEDYEIPEFTDVEAAKKWLEEWGQGGAIEVITETWILEPRTTFEWVRTRS